MIWIYCTTFVASLAGSLALSPVSIWLSKKFNVLDEPGERKVHPHPMPRWGGIAIAASFYLALLLAVLLFPRLKTLLAYRYHINASGEIEIFSLKKQLCGILFGSLAVLILGIWDDKAKLPALIKLPWQIISAFIAMVYGVRLFGIMPPGSANYYFFPVILSQLVTVFWLTGFMNTINLVDGLDGLAAGVCAIASGTFLVVAVLQGQTQVVLFSKQLKLAGVLSASLCGASLGFLWYNFYPAKAFMGDGGALFLGYNLAAITVIGTLKTTAFLSLVIPIVVVALPVLDVAVSIVRRMRQGKEVFEADQDHLHHRLLRHGWSQREVVLGVYVITLILSVFSVLLTVFKGKV